MTRRPRFPAISWIAQGPKRKGQYTLSGLEVTVIRYTQLEGNLKGLRSDSEKLKALVTKYEKIHDEGPGRRLLFTLKESSGLTDLRRRIGLHEQNLQLWYNTLVYASLRRLEGGQEAILKAIEKIKKWSPTKVQEVRRSLCEGNIKPLEQGLRQSGLERQAVDSALGTVVDYVNAPPFEQVRIESRARSCTTIHPEAGSFRPPVPPVYPQFAFDEDFGKSSEYQPPLNMHRSKSTSAQRPRYVYNSKDDFDIDYQRHGQDDTYQSLEKSKLSKVRLVAEKLAAEDPRRREKRYVSYNEKIVNPITVSGRPQRSSNTAKPPPRSSLLVVPDTGPRYRQASNHGPSDQHGQRSSDAGSRYQEEQVIILEPSRRHRSSSQRSDRSNRDRRDSSTHSYIRRRSSSRGQEGEE